ncbi:hypothetical protein [Cyanobium gracile]|uniref:hypothetical protein n=1 Tax=Cyanobium gracile TaxID=59930 RepID=UPI0009006012|nr:hypothetical protein [Cyanobium gracile]
MKRRVQLAAVEEQQVGAERQVEGVIGERQRRQFGVHVAPLQQAGRIILEKGLHRRHADLTQLLNGRDGVPDEG